MRRSKTNARRPAAAAAPRANRRKKLERGWSPLAFLRSPRNRRVRPRPPAATSTTATATAAAAAQAPRPPRSPVDVKALLRRVGRVSLRVARVALVVVALAGIGFGGLLAYRRVMNGNTFTVRSLQIEGARRAPRHELVRLVQSVVGRNIFAVDLAAASRAVKSHPWVRSARARRELPGRVVVEVTEHHAQALLLLGHLYLVDGEGRVFKRAAPDEVDGMAVITGLDRSDYLSNPEAARQRVLRALLRAGAPGALGGPRGCAGRGDPPPAPRGAGDPARGRPERRAAEAVRRGLGRARTRGPAGARRLPGPRGPG